MAEQQRWWEWKDDDLTIRLDTWLLGALSVGVYTGYQINPTNNMTLNLIHNDGVYYYDKDKNKVGPFSFLITNNGVVIKEDQTIQLPIVSGESKPRIDVVYLRHQYDEIVGGQQATYGVIQGTPSDEPVAPPLNDEATENIIGYLYVPSGATSILNNGVVWERLKSPLPSPQDYVDRKIGKRVINLDNSQLIHTVSGRISEDVIYVRAENVSPSGDHKIRLLNSNTDNGSEILFIIDDDSNIYNNSDSSFTLSVESDNGDGTFELLHLIPEKWTLKGNSSLNIQTRFDSKKWMLKDIGRLGTTFHSNTINVMNRPTVYSYKDTVDKDGNQAVVNVDSGSSFVNYDGEILVGILLRDKNNNELQDYPNGITVKIGFKSDSKIISNYENTDKLISFSSSSKGNVKNVDGVTSFQDRNVFVSEGDIVEFTYFNGEWCAMGYHNVQRIARLESIVQKWHDQWNNSLKERSFNYKSLSTTDVAAGGTTERDVWTTPNDGVSRRYILSCKIVWERISGGSVEMSAEAWIRRNGSDKDYCIEKTHQSGNANDNVPKIGTMNLIAYHDEPCDNVETWSLKFKANGVGMRFRNVRVSIVGEIIQDRGSI